MPAETRWRKVVHRFKRSVIVRHDPMHLMLGRVWRHGIVLFAIVVVAALSWICGYDCCSIQGFHIGKGYVAIGRDFVPAIQAFVALVSVIFVAHQLMKVIRNSRVVYTWNIRKATMDFITVHKQLKDDYKEIAKGWKDANGVPIPHYEKSRYKDCEDIEGKFSEVLNYFEALACGIKHGVYDDQIAFDQLRSLATRMFSFCGPYITEKRKEAPHAYELLEMIVKHWQEEAATLKAKNDKRLQEALQKKEQADREVEAIKRALGTVPPSTPLEL